MAKIQSLLNVFEDQLRDIFSAETQLIDGLDYMASAASSFVLRKAFNDHLKETRDQIARLKKIASRMEIPLSGKECKAIRSLLEEVSEILGERSYDAALRDARLIAVAKKVEHYEIAAYSTLRALAQDLELSTATFLLQDSLDEELASDRILSEICEEEIFKNQPAPATS